jgi:hypothetical protein
MGILKISGIEKGEIDMVARRRLLSALRYNLPRTDLEEIIGEAYNPAVLPSYSLTSLSLKGEEQEKRVQRIWKALVTQRPIKVRKKKNDCNM